MEPTARNTGSTFLKIFRTLCKDAWAGAIPDAILGYAVNSEISDFRIRPHHYLWEDKDLRRLFDFLHLGVLDFSWKASVIGTGEIWLGYIIKKAVEDE